MGPCGTTCSPHAALASLHCSSKKPSHSAAPCSRLCADSTFSGALQVESELKELDREEAAEFLASLGASETGLSSLVRASYQQLGLRTYFTTGKCQRCGPTSSWSDGVARMMHMLSKTSCIALLCGCLLTDGVKWDLLGL